jgi:pimeloyl-ACP methyl ester carboxylesterase
MSGLVGADVDQLEALAARFDRQADAYRQIAGSSSTALMVATWTGADIERVRSEWNSSSKPSILRASAELRALALELRRQASQQREASSAKSPGRGAASSAVHTRDLIDHIDGMGDKLIDYERIVGPNGEARYVFYINGTSGSLPDGPGDLTVEKLNELFQMHGWANTIPQSFNIEAPTSGEAFFRAYMAMVLAANGEEGAEIMVVGYSQGGMVAEGIADDSGLNVREVVTIGSPPVPPSHGLNGANVTRLVSSADEIVNGVAVARTYAGIALKVVGLLSGPLLGPPVAAAGAALTAMADPAPSAYSGDVTTFRASDGTSDWGGAHDLRHDPRYREVAEDFDRSTDPDVIEANERITRFRDPGSN